MVVSFPVKKKEKWKKKRKPGPKKKVGRPKKIIDAEIKEELGPKIHNSCYREKRKFTFLDYPEFVIQTKLRLKYDGISFEELITRLLRLYVGRNKEIMSVVRVIQEENKAIPSKWIEESKIERERGEFLEELYKLSDEEKESIFDILASEHPEL